MRDQDLGYFYKGDFAAINDGFIHDGMDAMGRISSVQRKYNKGDIDTVLNELHDAYVGECLGFGLVNNNKHGFDCKLSEDADVFLESKVASTAAKTISATFNDTTLEKADAFMDKKVWLALSVWRSASELLFICYGQHRGVGEYLREGVIKAKNERRRSTQTIGLQKLVFDYNFDILAVSGSKYDVYSYLNERSSKYREMDINRIKELKDYRGITIAS